MHKIAAEINIPLTKSTTRNSGKNYSTAFSDKTRTAQNVARMEEKQNAYRILVGKPEGKRPLGRPRRRWWTILKWILEIYDGMEWIGWIWLRIGTSGGLL
jgi:hypothetical protein